MSVTEPTFISLTGGYIHTEDIRGAETVDDGFVLYVKTKPMPIHITDPEDCVMLGQWFESHSWKADE